MQKILRSAAQNVIVAALTLIGVYIASPYSGDIQCRILGSCSAGLASINLSPVAGLIYGYLFFIPIVLIVFGFGAKARYLWALAFVLPVVVWFLITGANATVITPVVLFTAAGFLLGHLLTKTISNFLPSVTSHINGV